MRKIRFTEEQMVAILQESETSKTLEAVCRKHGIRKQTLSKWKQKFGGMQPTHVKKLKQRMKMLGSSEWWQIFHSKTMR